MTELQIDLKCVKDGDLTYPDIFSPFDEGLH